MEMDILINADKVDVMCRICHSEGTNMKMLTSKMESDNRTIAEVLSFILNLYISVSEQYPKQVCDECHRIILKFDTFKKRCIDSEGSLYECYYTEQKAHAIALNKFCMDEPYQCSICLKKFSDLLLLESHVLTGHNYSNEPRRKDLILSENIIKFSEYSLNASLYGGAIDNDAGEVEDKKDFDLTNSNYDFATSPTDCKKEIEEVDSQEVKCDTQLGHFNEISLHVNQNNCDDYVEKEIKVPKKIKSEKPKKRKTIIRTCSQCNNEFNTFKSYKMHLRQHKLENLNHSEIFECSMCLRRFTKKSAYISHLKSHEKKANIKFKCKTCKREFQHQAHLDNHMLSVHTHSTGYSCEICGHKFSTAYNLNIHRDTHITEKRHQCNICSKKFYMLSTLKDHLRTHTGEKPYLCSACGKSFSQKNNLAQHMRRHQGLKLFKCEHCDNSFVSKGELVAHTRKHSGAHPFVCGECGKGFTTSSSLVKHRRIHTGERPYACDLCDMKFTASGTLRNHRRIHTGEKPYQCSYCQKAFVQRQDLVSHIRCHTGERPFVCPQCEQAFRKSSGLKAHLKIHAKESMPPPVQKDANLAVLHGVNILIGDVGVQDLITG